MTFIEVVINTFLEFLEDSIKEFLSWLVKCLISIHISHPYSLPEAYSFILALLIVGKDGEKEWKVMSDDEKFESVSLNRIDRNTKSCFGNRLYYYAHRGMQVQIPLPPKIDPSVDMMTVEEKPDLTYNDVGDCKEQIEKMRKAKEGGGNAK
ncbi:hypothetical protein MTR_8g074160 [Medicago truncatula]|uniref:Uncharacterized protein n=1 Tax=Medicago truncatula TaxID=3880 RepID=G7LA63_MEDTR|nr:hypothetical protein MTR_8g074160 [Medicago truncatula]